jgi:glycosyltransferase involved in cell wall biosynthesis
VPLVTVCIPTYNYAAYLGDAIGSVLQQTHTDVEVVVVDNCSTDGTGPLVDGWLRRDKRVRYVRNDTNVGMARNFNLALQQARGEYVKVLCADDWLHPRALELSVAELKRHPRAALVTTGRILVAQQNDKSGLASYCARPGVIDGPSAIRRCLFGTNYIGEPSATMFRHGLVRRGFDETYPHLVDLEMWFHLLEQGDLVCIPQGLAYIRQHEAQGTQTNIRARQILADKKRLYAMYGARDYIRSTWMDRTLWKLRMAYNAWTAQQSTGAGGPGDVSEFVPVPVFYAALPFMMGSHGVRTALQRVRYRFKRRSAVP